MAGVGVGSGVLVGVGVDSGVLVGVKVGEIGVGVGLARIAVGVGTVVAVGGRVGLGAWAVMVAITSRVAWV